jgi:hypothetical protein
MLWIKDHDISKARAEISASIPADLHPDHQHAQNPLAPNIWVEPEDQHQRTLLSYVLRKQQHYCTEHGKPGCCEKGSCSGMYPHQPHPDRLATQDDDNNWYYYRPRHIDRNVVPYHPGLLLLWRGNLNLKIVTAGAWASYLLKYQLKVTLGMHDGSYDRPASC